MKNVSYHIVLFIFAAAQLSCLDQVNLDIKDGVTNMVVYGWITNETKAYEIKLSRSTSYSDQSGYPPLTGAEVYVTDDLGNRFDFDELPDTGSYFSDPSQMTGVPGRSYQLSIVIADERYRSSIEPLTPLADIENAFINFIADPANFEIEPEDENFFVSAFIDDNPATENYYRWKVYVNGVFRNQPEDLVLFDDRFTNGNRFRYDAGNVLFTQGDVARIQHMSLSKAAYNFLLDIRNQTSNSTLTPRTQPGSIQGNIVNLSDPNELVLGYFGASAVTTVQVGN